LDPFSPDNGGDVSKLADFEKTLAFRVLNSSPGRATSERHGQDNPQVTNCDEMRADEYRYCQSRPVPERMDAVEEMIQAAYALKGGRSSRMYPNYKDLLSAFHAAWR
jgi:hypothetical protein